MEVNGTARPPPTAATTDRYVAPPKRPRPQTERPGRTGGASSAIAEEEEGEMGAGEEEALAAYKKMTKQRKK